MGLFANLATRIKALNPIGIAKAVAVRAFSAAKISRLTSSWETTDKLINEELRGDLDRLRQRSRQLFKDNEYGKKFGRMVRNNVVGQNGFRLKHRVYNDDGTPDTLAQAAIAEAFKCWCRRGVCEIAGRQSFRDLQRGLIVDAARDGEFLFRKIRGAAARNSFGFALQRLDPSRLDTQCNRDAVSGSNAIIMGVEVDDYQRAVAYHILAAGGALHGPRKRERIPADEIVHGFIPDDFCEAVRGVPWMYAAMLRLNDLGAYREASIIAARIGASKMGFYIQREDSGAANPEELADGKDAEGNLYEEVEPGMLEVLPAQFSDFKTFDTSYPHEQFDPFTKATLRGISSGIGVSYVGLANDLQGVNYSSIRQGVLDERDEWMTIQDWFIEAALEEIYPDWLRFALLNGQIKSATGVSLPISKFEKFLAHEWQGRRWSWVDPLKDAQAAILKLKEKLTSRTRIAAEAGVDLEEVFAELENEEKLAAEYNIDLADLVPAVAAPAKDIPDEEDDDAQTD